MVCITGPPFGVMFENRQLNTCHVILGRSNLYSGTVHVVYNILPKNENIFVRWQTHSNG